jgi:hypothetical protein
MKFEWLRIFSDVGVPHLALERDGISIRLSRAARLTIAGAPEPAANAQGASQS